MLQYFWQSPSRWYHSLHFITFYLHEILKHKKLVLTASSHISISDQHSPYQGANSHFTTKTKLPWSSQHTSVHQVLVSRFASADSMWRIPVWSAGLHTKGTVPWSTWLLHTAAKELEIWELLCRVCLLRLSPEIPGLVQRGWQRAAWAQGQSKRGNTRCLLGFQAPADGLVAWLATTESNWLFSSFWPI